MSFGTATEALDRSAALEFIKKAIRACAERGQDQEPKCTELARLHGFNPEKVRMGFHAARAEWTALEDAGEALPAAVEKASPEQTSNEEKRVAVAIPTLAAKPPCTLLRAPNPVRTVAKTSESVCM